MAKFDANRDDVMETRICKECGNSFTITKSEMEDLKRRCGETFALPLRCHDCRSKKGQIYRTACCKKCGTLFSISLLEKDDYIRKGLELPKHCSKCRNKMKRRKMVAVNKPVIDVKVAVDM